MCGGAPAQASPLRVTRPSTLLTKNDMHPSGADVAPPSSSWGPGPMARSWMTPVELMMPACESANPAPVLPPTVGDCGETPSTDFGPTILHSRFPNCTPSHGVPLSLLPLPAGAALPPALPPVVSDVDFSRNTEFAPRGAVKAAWCRGCHYQSDDAGCVCANRSHMISASSSSPQLGSKPRGGHGGHLSSSPSSSSSESSEIRSSRFASLWGLGGGADWTWAPTTTAQVEANFLPTVSSAERLPVPTAAPPSPPSPRTESKIRRDSLPSPPGSGRTRRARATSPPSPSLLPLRQSEDPCWGTSAFMPTPPSTTHDAVVAPRHDASWSMTTELTKEMELLGLDSRVVQGMCEVGITYPLQLQRAVIDAVRSGRDVVVSGQPGTGRTTAVGVALLDAVDLELGPQALIISPTKETAVETQRGLAAAGRYRRVKVHASFGGKSGDRAHIKSRRPHIISATLGRALDNMKRGGPIVPSELRTLVIDDCDQMHRKFPGEMAQLFAILPSTCQVILVSGGLGRSTRDWAATVLRDPLRVDAAAFGDSRAHDDVHVGAFPSIHEITA